MWPLRDTAGLNASQRDSTGGKAETLHERHEGYIGTSKSVNPRGPAVFPIVFFHLVSDWRCQIAKRICNAEVPRTFVSCHGGSKIWKIENVTWNASFRAVEACKFMKFDR